MRIVAALLSESAVARDGLISILNAGVNIISNESLPAPLSTTLAVVLELDSEDIVSSFQIEMSVYHGADDTGSLLGTTEAFWEAGDPAFSDLPSFVNLAVPLAPIILTEYGIHSIKIVAGNLPPFYIQFKAIQLEGSLSYDEMRKRISEKTL